MLNNLPSGVMQDFYDRNKEHISMPYEDYMQHAFEKFSPAQIESIGENLHQRHYNHMSKDEYDTKSGMSDWRNNRPSWVGNVFRGMGERAADLAGGMIELFNTALKTAGVPDEEVEPILGQMAEDLRNVDFGYKEWTTWEDVKTGNPWKIFAFAMEQGLISAPDMAAVMINLPAYVAARTGELAHERSVADGMREANGYDLLVALPTATVSAVLERIGAMSILGVGKAGAMKGAKVILKDIKTAQNNLPKTGGVKGFAGAVGRAAATEMATEAAQEAIEYTGTTTGTEHGFRPEEAAHAAAVGATVGSIFGGTVRVPTAGYQVARGRTQENVDKQAEALKRQEEEAQAARHQSSLDAEVEAERGVRPRIENPAGLKTGDNVMISRWDKPAQIGVVELNQDTGIISVRDAEGDVIDTYDLNSPDGRTAFYGLTDEEKDQFLQPGGEQPSPEEEQQQSYNDEVARLIARAQAKPGNKTRIEALIDARKDQNFKNLPPELRDQIDDLIEGSEAASPSTASPAPEAPSQPSPKKKVKNKPVEPEKPPEPVKQEETEPVKPATTEPPEVVEPEKPPEPVKIIEPPKPVEPEREPIELREQETRPGKIYWKDETKEVDVDYAVVELDDVLESHTESGEEIPGYPQWKQPRDRSDPKSVAKTKETIGNFRPEKVLLETVEGQTGTPVIDRTGVVEAGNGRLIAIRGVYNRADTGSEQHSELIKQYQQHLRGRFNIEGMKKPVLVRVRRTDMVRKELREFIRDMNTSVQEQNTEVVDAEADSDKYDYSLLELYVPGSFDSPKNEAFKAAVLERVIPANERSKMLDENGDLSEIGQRRIEIGLIQKAYGDPELTKKFFTDKYKGVLTVRNILAQIAPSWARYRTSIDDGNLDSEWNIADIISPLAKDLANYYVNRKKGRATAPISDIISGRDLFDQQGSDIREAVGRLFYTTKKGKEVLDRPATIASKFHIFLALARAHTKIDKNLGGLDFGEPDPAEAITNERIVELFKEISEFDRADLMETIRSITFSGLTPIAGHELKNTYSELMLTGMELSGVVAGSEMTVLRELIKSLSARPQSTPQELPSRISKILTKFESSDDWTDEGFNAFTKEGAPKSLVLGAKALVKWVQENTGVYEQLETGDQERISAVIDSLNNWEPAVPAPAPEEQPAPAVADPDLTDPETGEVDTEETIPVPVVQKGDPEPEPQPVVKVEETPPVEEKQEEEPEQKPADKYDGDTSQPWKHDEVNYAEAATEVQNIFQNKIRLASLKVGSDKLSEIVLRYQLIAEELFKLASVNDANADEQVVKYAVDSLIATIANPDVLSAGKIMREHVLSSDFKINKSSYAELFKPKSAVDVYKAGRIYARLRLARHFLQGALNETVLREYDQTEALEFIRTEIGRVIMDVNPKSMPEWATFHGKKPPTVWSKYKNQERWSDFVLWSKDDHAEPDVWISASPYFRGRSEELVRAYNETFNYMDAYVDGIEAKQPDPPPDTEKIEEQEKERERERELSLVTSSVERAESFVNRLLDKNLNYLVEPDFFFEELVKMTDTDKFKGLPDELKARIEAVIQRFNDWKSGLPPVLEFDDSGNVEGDWQKDAVDYSTTLKNMVDKYRSKSTTDHTEVGLNIRKLLAEEFVRLLYADVQVAEGYAENFAQIQQYVHDTLLHTMTGDDRGKNVASKISRSYIQAAGSDMSKAKLQELMPQVIEKIWGTDGRDDYSPTNVLIEMYAQLRLARHYMDGAMTEIAESQADGPQAIVKAREHLSRIVGELEPKKARKTDTYQGKPVSEQPELFFTSKDNYSRWVLFPRTNERIRYFIHPWFNSASTSSRPRRVREDSKNYNKTFNNLDAYLAGFKSVVADVEDRPIEGLIDSDVKVDIDNLLEEEDQRDNEEITRQIEDLIGADEGGSLFSVQLPDEIEVTPTPDDEIEFNPEDLDNLKGISNERLTNVLKALAIMLRRTIAEHEYKAKNKMPITLDQQHYKRRLKEKLRQARDEDTRRRGHKPEDHLGAKYKVKMDRVKSTVVDQDTGEASERWNYRLYNLTAKKKQPHHHVEGINAILREKAEDLRKEGIDIRDENPLKGLGGVSAHISDASASDKQGYTFAGNPFAEWEIVKALGLEYSDDLMGELLNDALGEESEIAMKQFSSVDHAPKLEKKEQLQKNSAAYKFIEGGIAAGLDREIVENQKDDVARIIKAKNDGQRAFILGTPTGSGKTFMLGAAMKQMLDADPTLNFVYVTKAAQLFDQVKKDLSPILKTAFEKGDRADKPVPGAVRLMSYDGIRNKVPENAHMDRADGYSEVSFDRLVDDRTVVILDEGHRAINIRSKTIASLYHILSRSNFNIMASATPFTNPATAQYLYYLGAFDKVNHNEALLDEGGLTKFLEFVRRYGATIGNRETQRRMEINETSDPKHPWVTPKAEWRVQNQVKERALEFLQEITRMGIYITRQEVLDPSMTENEFEEVKMDRRAVNVYRFIQRVYDDASSIIGQIGGSAMDLAKHRANLNKRYAEAAKIQVGADKVMQEIYYARRLVDWTGKDNPKKKQSQTLRYLLKMYEAGNQFGWTEILWKKSSTHFRADNIETVDGKNYITVRLNSGDWVKVEVEERQTVAFIESKNERYINRFAISDLKDPTAVWDNENVEDPEKVANWKARRTYSVEEVIAYFNEYRNLPMAVKYDALGNPTAKTDFRYSKFGAYQVALALAYNNNQMTAGYSLPGTKSHLYEALRKRGLDEKDIVFYTGDETATPEISGGNKDTFNAGNAKVIIVTMAAGGTGLSLHDTAGDKPRSLVGIILPWSPTTMVQVLGRISRLGMKSKARIKWLVARDFDIEQTLGDRLLERLQAFDFSVSGRKQAASGSIQDVISSWRDPQGDLSDEDYYRQLNEEMNPVDQVESGADPKIAEQDQEFETLMNQARVDGTHHTLVGDLESIGEGSGWGDYARRRGVFFDPSGDRNHSIPRHMQRALKEFAQLLSPGTDIKYKKWIHKNSPSGRPLPVGGKYDMASSVLTIAQTFGPAYDYKPVDVIQVMGHEHLHYFRRQGLVTDAEYGLLLEDSKRLGLKEKYDIENRYADQTPDIKEEEALAEAFGYYAKARWEARQTMFSERIRQFFERIIVYLRLIADRMGLYQASAEDVYQRMYHGIAGRRRPTGVLAQGERLNVGQVVDSQYLSESDRRFAIAKYEMSNGLPFFRYTGEIDEIGDGQRKTYDQWVGKDVTVRLDINETNKNIRVDKSAAWAIKETQISKAGTQVKNNTMGKAIPGLNNMSAVRIKLDQPEISAVNFSRKRMQNLGEKKHRETHAVIRGTLAELGNVPEIPMNNPERRYMRVSYYFRELHEGREAGFYLQDYLEERDLQEIAAMSSMKGSDVRPLSRETTEKIVEGERALNQFIGSDMDLIFTSSGVWLDVLSGKTMTMQQKLEDMLRTPRVKSIGNELSTGQKVTHMKRAVTKFVENPKYKAYAGKAEGIRSRKNVEDKIKELSHAVSATGEVERRRVNRHNVMQQAYKDNLAIMQGLWESVRYNPSFWTDESQTASDLRAAYRMYVGDLNEAEILTEIDRHVAGSRQWVDEMGEFMLTEMGDMYQEILSLKQRYKASPYVVLTNSETSEMNALNYSSPLELVQAIDRAIARRGLESIEEQNEFANSILESAYDRNEKALKVLRDLKPLINSEVRLINAAKRRLIDEGVFYQTGKDSHHLYTEVGLLRIKDHSYVDGRGWSYALQTPDKEVVIDRSRMADQDYVNQKNVEVMAAIDAMIANPVPEDQVYFFESGAGDRKAQRGVRINKPKRLAALKKQYADDENILYSRGTVHSKGDKTYTPYVSADNPEVEQNLRDAMEGAKPSSLRERMADALVTEWHRWTRHRKHIDQGKDKGEYNAEFLQKLRQAEASPEVAASRIQNYFYRISTGLNKREYDLFTRAVIFPDLIWTAEQGMEIPFGFASAEEVQIELDKVNAEIDSNPNLIKTRKVGGKTEQYNVIREKLAYRQRELEMLRQELVASGAMPWSRLKNVHYFHHQILEYAELKNKFGHGGAKAATPFIHRRRGSYKAFNADYFQAEAAWMFKARNDIAMAKLLGHMRTSKYNKFRAFNQRARSDNAKHVHSVLVNDIYHGLLQMNDPRATNLARTKYRIQDAKYDHPLNLMRQFKKDLRDNKLMSAYNALSENDDILRFTREYDQYRIQIARYINTIAYQSSLIGESAMALIPVDLLPVLKNLRKRYSDPDNVDDNSDLLKFASWLTNTEAPELENMRKAALGLFSAISGRKILIKETLGDSYVDPDNRELLISEYGSPEEQRTWQADSFDGKTRAVHIYSAYTVPEHIFERSSDHIIKAFEEALNTDDVSIADVLKGLKYGDQKTIKVNARQVAELIKSARQQSVIGGLKEQMILPREIADTLDEFRDPYVEQMLDKALVEVQSRWKRWILFMPRRIFKYTLNNMTSDIDALIANPSATGAFKHLPQAFREIKGYIYDGALPSDELTEALNMGVITSALVTQELADKAYRDLEFMGRDMEPRDFVATFNQGLNKYNPVDKYMRTVTNMVSLRESGFRYAAYLHYRKQFVELNKTPEDIGYGATPPWMIAGVQDKYELAAMMARDALGDYGNLSERGRQIRRRIIPFWSWAESNTRRYANLFANIGRYSATRDKAVAGGLVAASLIARMFAFYALVNMWNFLFFGDDEERLDTEQSLQLHLNLGVIEGEQTSLRFQGALSDFLGWFNMEDAGAVIKEVQGGKATFTDVFQEILKGPPNKIAQGISPIFKLPVELLSGVQFYPDIFNPYSINDPWEHGTRTLAMHEEYKAIANFAGYPVPHENYLRWGNLASIFVYQREKGELHYNWARRQAYKWKERTKDPAGKRKMFNAYRKALKYEDFETARQIQRRLRDEYGAKGRSFKLSFTRMSPLGMLTKKERQEYLRSLSPSERAKLREAMDYWRAEQRARKQQLREAR